VVSKTAKRIWILVFYGEFLCLNLAIADLGSSLYFVAVIAESHINFTDFCSSHLIPSIGIVFEPASVLWVCCFSTALSLLLVRSRNFQTSSQLASYLHQQLSIFMAISWLIPLTLALYYHFKLPSEGDWFAGNVWCEAKSKAWARYLFYIPVVVAFVYNIILLFTIFIINKKKRLGLKKLNLFWYIPIFLIVWALPTIHALMPNGTILDNFIVTVISTLSLPSQGFLNSIIWITVLRNPVHRSDDEEVILLGQSRISRTSVNIFGNTIEWFVDL